MSLKLFFLSVILILFVPHSAFSVQYPKVNSYEINAAFTPDKGSMSAGVKVTFSGDIHLDDSICFYLHGELKVDSILQASHKINFSQQKVSYYYDYSMQSTQVKFIVRPDNNINSLEIFYAGRFNPSNARTPSDYMRIDSDGVFLRAYGYSLWFPIFLEHKGPSYTVDFNRAVFHVPADFKCVFVGNLTNEYRQGDNVVSIWKAENIDLIDAQCSVQKWNVISDDWLKIYYWPDSVSTDKAREILDFTASFHRACDRHFRRNMLPEQGYIIEMPHYGDISSANVTGISDRLWKTFGDEQHSLETFAHEIVHPYVQIPIDRNDPLYAMVIEGFPNYFDALVLKDYLGSDWFEKVLMEMEKSYLQKKSCGTDEDGKSLPVDKPLDQISADEIGLYKDKFILSSRTSLFFNYLRLKMGVDKYAKFERTLFDSDSMTLTGFKKSILQYLPTSVEDLEIWLSSIEYPDRFHLTNLK